MRKLRGKMKKYYVVHGLEDADNDGQKQLIAIPRIAQTKALLEFIEADEESVFGPELYDYAMTTVAEMTPGDVWTLTQGRSDVQVDVVPDAVMIERGRSVESLKAHIAITNETGDCSNWKQFFVR